MRIAPLVVRPEPPPWALDRITLPRPPWVRREGKSPAPAISAPIISRGCGECAPHPLFSPPASERKAKPCT